MRRNDIRHLRPGGPVAVHVIGEGRDLGWWPARVTELNEWGGLVEGATPSAANVLRNLFSGAIDQYSAPFVVRLPRAAAEEKRS